MGFMAADPAATRGKRLGTEAAAPGDSNDVPPADRPDPGARTKVSSPGRAAFSSPSPPRRNDRGSSPAGPTHRLRPSDRPEQPRDAPRAGRQAGTGPVHHVGRVHAPGPPGRGRRAPPL